jgi:hypothetical protein
MTKVKVFKKKVKLQGQISEGLDHDMKWKVLPEGIHIWNMKAPAPTNQKLWPRLIVFEKKVKILGQRRSWYQMKGLARRNTYVCKIWKPYHLPIKSYNQG